LPGAAGHYGAPKRRDDLHYVPSDDVWRGRRPHAHAYANPIPHANRDGIVYAHADANRNGNIHAHPDSYALRRPHKDGNAFIHAHPDEYALVNAHRDADEYGVAYADLDAYANSQCDANAECNADAECDADAQCDANEYVYRFADADDHADVDARPCADGGSHQSWHTNLGAFPTACGLRRSARSFPGGLAR